MTGLARSNVTQVVTCFSDIVCPWATVQIDRFCTARARAGLEAHIVLDHRAFPLELVNDRPHGRLLHDTEMAVAGGVHPTYGFRAWTAGDSWPVSTLVPLEAVQAAKLQGRRQSEDLDRALRRAMHTESRCIALRGVVLEVAAKIDGLDVEALTDALDDGRSRRTVLDDWRDAEADGAEGSPTFIAPDGTCWFNPGITLRWIKGDGGYPIVADDDPSVWDTLLRGLVDGSAP
jgi:predicted DsbA family dithiol-disulfide isomerase